MGSDGWPSPVRTPQTRTGAISALAGLLLAATPAASANTPDWAHPRTLPSLVRYWHFDMVPCGIGLHDGTVYAFDGTRLVALDARTGVRRWETVAAIPIGGSFRSRRAVSGFTGVGAGTRGLGSTLNLPPSRPCEPDSS